MINMLKRVFLIVMPILALVMLVRFTAHKPPFFESEKLLDYIETFEGFENFKTSFAEVKESFNQFEEITLQFNDIENPDTLNYVRLIADYIAAFINFIGALLTLIVSVVRDLIYIIGWILGFFSYVLFA